MKEVHVGLSRFISIQKLLGSDAPVFHAHPQSCLCIVLRGSYWEHSLLFDTNGKPLAPLVTLRKAGNIFFRRSTSKQWAELDGREPATVLFFNGL